MTTRTLYNNTQEEWQIAFSGGSLPGLSGASQAPDGTWSGSLPSNQNCSLEFDENSGSIWLTSAKGTKWSYNFTTNAFDSNPSWNHNGDTPGCTLNDPANGDFQILADVPQYLAAIETKVEPGGRPKMSHI